MTYQNSLSTTLACQVNQNPIATILVAVGLLAVFWISIGRVYYLRWYYERQGIVFVKNCYPVIGAELDVTKLREENKSHDWLYKSRHADLIGTIRGFSVQLYGITTEACDKLILETGKSIDRRSPALFSFGRLSPCAITFTPMSRPLFKHRKTNLIRALNDMSRIYQIANIQAKRVLANVNEKGKGHTVDVRGLLDEWTRDTTGEFVWGANTMNRIVRAYEPSGRLVDLPFIAAVNYTDTGLRFYSDGFWNRLYAPLAAWPITKRARRLTYNIQVLQSELDKILARPEEGTVASRLKKDNDSMAIPADMTRDDLTTATVGGLDTIKSAIMATLWNLLQPCNQEWKHKVLSELDRLAKESQSAHQALMHCDTLTAVILESLRTHPPGSLINNRAVADFDILLPDKAYRIKSGTQIVPCVHAMNQSRDCWGLESRPDMANLDQFDPNRFLQYGPNIIGSSYFLPFGKGPRRCPGQAVGLLMVKSFVTVFLQSNGECRVTLPEGQSRNATCFNILSKATFNLHCNESSVC